MSMNFMTGVSLVNLDSLKGLSMSGCVDTLAHLPRFCGRGNHKIKVLDHSLLCLDIAQALYGTEDPSLQMAVLTHDLPESITNDIPTYVKQYLSAVTPGAMKGLKLLEQRVWEYFSLWDCVRTYEYHIKRVDTISLVTEAKEEFTRFNPVDWPAPDCRDLTDLKLAEMFHERVNNPRNKNSFMYHYNRLRNELTAQAMSREEAEQEFRRVLRA